MAITNDYLYDLPSSGDFYNLLKNTIAPNFTFTQSNLYDALAQIYLYLDGVPTLDENNVLGIEYFNDDTGDTFTEIPTDRITTLSEDRYVNGLITDYQKGDIEKEIVFPCNKGFARTQTIKAGVPTEDSYVFKTDFPIREILKVEVILNSVSDSKFKTTSNPSPTTGTATGEVAIDITRYVFADEQYSLLEKSTNAISHTPTLNNSVYYTQGDNKVYVGSVVQPVITTKLVIDNLLGSACYDNFGLGVNSAGISDPTPQYLRYRITYKPILNGRLKIEGNENKYQGEERLDQNQGSVDLSRIGINLFGNINKLGNEEKTVQRKFCNLNNLVKKGTIWTDTNNNRWLANIVETTFYKDFAIQTINFTKNFNKLSSFISMNYDKRFSEISSTLTQKSEDTYCEYLYFSSSENGASLANAIHFNNTFLPTILSTLNNATIVRQIDYSVVKAFTDDNNACNDNGNIFIPLVKYGSGNALCFEMTFDSPSSAGLQLSTAGDWLTGSYFSNYVIYTTKNGFADIFNIEFYDLLQNDGVNFSQIFPQISDTIISNSTKYGGFDYLRFYKKPNEIFALNYELICLPYSNEKYFFGEEFIKNNALLGNIVNGSNKLFVSTTEEYSILDKKAVGSEISLNNFSFTNEATSNTKITRLSVIVATAIQQNIVSWCIADQNNNILIACNNEITATNNISFYIFTSHNRLLQ